MRTAARTRAMDRDGAWLRPRLPVLAAGLFAGLAVTFAASAASTENRNDAVASQPTLGVQKLLVVDAAGAGDERITNALTGSRSLFRRYSYGKLSLSWTIVTANAYPAGCSYDARAAIDLVDPQVDFSRYDRLVLVLPDHNCGWAGQAQLAPTTYDTGEGSRRLTVAWLLGRTLSADKLTHELGHTFGNNHARTFKCERGLLPTADSPCTTVEYGDEDDLMGSGTGGWNAIERELTGWLNPGNVLATSRAGVYKLEDINRNDRLLKALKVRRDTCSDQALWVENDAGKVIVRSAGTFVPGVTAQQYPGCSRNSIDQYKELVAALAPGESLRDPNTGARIKVLSVKGAFAKVRLNGAGRTDFSAPQLHLTAPTADTNVAGQVTLTAEASDESSGIAKVVFYENSPTEPFAVDTEPPYTATVDTRKLPNGPLQLQAITFDRAAERWGGLGNASAPELIHVTVANTDSASPSASLVTPTNGSSVRLVAALVARADDDMRVHQVSFTIDGKLAGNGKPVGDGTYRLDNPAALEPLRDLGPHTVRVYVWDAVFNEAEDASTFTVTGPSTPDVSFAAPLASTQLHAGGTVMVTVGVGGNPYVREVAITVNGSTVCSLSGASIYACAWQPARAGTYTLAARASDDLGNTGSATLTVHVT
jgi:Bacterial Ig domain/Gametolysin peptidase M11